MSVDKLLAVEELPELTFYFDAERVTDSAYGQLSERKRKVAPSATEVREAAIDIWFLLRDEWLADTGMILAERWGQVLIESIESIEPIETVMMEVNPDYWHSVDLYGDADEDAQALAFCLAVILYVRTVNQLQLTECYPWTIEQVQAWMNASVTVAAKSAPQLLLVETAAVVAKSIRPKHAVKAMKPVVPVVAQMELALW